MNTYKNRKSIHGVFVGGSNDSAICEKCEIDFTYNYIYLSQQHVGKKFLGVNSFPQDQNCLIKNVAYGKN